MITEYYFPDKIYSEELGELIYSWEGLATYPKKVLKMINNIAGYYSNNNKKEYYVKVINDNNFGIYTDKKTKNKIGTGIKK